ncbi:cupin domain-containing protein [Flagellimonas zhangzhouensis]|uniref:Cupin domain-containing protein n=1 Tax=Flagellimonas zhangzhouensis TaxID=1073328 RepID=A0A1H2VL94_9FLAO|nr:cupin domain-containing protein [Allomuricauda zhangzhouensis]SDQ07297.1 Cupin domain-containing protein [Allomuricauda zhangzhouensis]SDW68724.1 Cupin domain-containing protein [Allomuricauda zhangzhouensis]
MDRKKFIKTSGVGLGLALIPGLLQGQNRNSETNFTKANDPKIIKETEGNVLNVIGDIQTHKVSGKDTGNQIVEWVSNVDPGVGIPPHIHTKEDEIFRVIKGEVEIMVGGKTTLLKAGDIAFAPRDVVHAWKVVGTEKAQMISSAFPAGIEVMFAELAQLPPGPPDFAKVTEICAKQGISFV